tara:strand:+ start:54 stop:389 length:336 start_codon:yes stop_codon:yes gene_type:complete
MQPLNMKIQNSFTERHPMQATTFAFPKSGGAGLGGQTVYPVQSTDKSLRSMDHASRIFSPYLTPSAVHAENRQIAQGSLAPTYQQNIAATKYFNVSTTSKLRPHLHTNLIA